MLYNNRKALFLMFMGIIVLLFPQTIQTVKAAEVSFSEFGNFSDYNAHLSQDDVVYAYKGNSLVKTDIYGQVLWERIIDGDQYTGQIGLYDDYLSIGTQKGYALFINQNNGTIKKQYKIPSDYSVTAAFLDEEGKVYAISSGYIYLLRPNGTFIKKSDYYSSFVLHLDENYVILTNSNRDNATWVDLSDLSSFEYVSSKNVRAIDPSNNKIYSSYSNKLYAYQLNNGRELWSLNIKDNQRISSVAVGLDGTLYVGMEKGGFYSVDPISREINWSFEEGTPTWGQAVVSSNGNIFVGQDNSSVQQYYIFEFNQKGDIISMSPVINSAKSLVIRKDNSLYYMNKNKLYSSKAVSVSNENIPKEDGDDNNDVEKPSLSFKQYGQFGAYQTKYYTDNAVYAYDDKGLVKTSINGDFIWEVRAKDGKFTGQIQLFDDYLSVGTTEGFAYFINPDDGKLIDKYEIPTDYSVTAAYKYAGNIFAISSGYIYEIRPDGTLVKKSDYYSSSVLHLDENYVILTNSNRDNATWVDLSDLSSFEYISSKNVRAIDYSNNKIYSSYSNKLYAYQLNNGRELWSMTINADKRITEVGIGSNGIIYVGTEKGGFYAVDTNSREIKWKFEEGTPNWGRAVVDQEGNIYVGQDNDNVQQYYIFKFDSNGKQLGIIPVNASARDLYIRDDSSLYYINKHNYYSSTIPTQPKPEPEPNPGQDDDGFTARDPKFNVAINKVWEVEYSLPVDISTVIEKNIYVTDTNNNILPMLYIFDKNTSKTKIYISPVKDYKKGEKYTLWIKDVNSENGQILNENVKMEFTIKK